MVLHVNILVVLNLGLNILPAPSTFKWPFTDADFQMFSYILYQVLLFICIDYNALGPNACMYK